MSLTRKEQRELLDLLDNYPSNTVPIEAASEWYFLSALYEGDFMTDRRIWNFDDAFKLMKISPPPWFTRKLQAYEEEVRRDLQEEEEGSSQSQ